MTKEQFENFKTNVEKNIAKERRIIGLCVSVLSKGYNDSILNCLNQSYAILKQLEHSLEDGLARYELEKMYENDNQ